MKNGRKGMYENGKKGTSKRQRKNVMRKWPNTIKMYQKMYEIF